MKFSIHSAHTKRLFFHYFFSYCLVVVLPLDICTSVRRLTAVLMCTGKKLKIHSMKPYERFYYNNCIFHTVESVRKIMKMRKSILYICD